MSTSALITLHGLSRFSAQSGLTTVTFYRHCDGDMNWPMANFFYQAFNNPLRAKGGYFGAFMCSAPSEVEFYNFFEYRNNECHSQYHYHLDVVTMELIVMHEDEALGIELRECFRGPIDLFINTYSHHPAKNELGYKRAIVSNHEYNQCGKHVFTINGMISEINNYLNQLEQHIKSPRNPNNKNWVKKIDRRLILLSECNLSSECQTWRQEILQLNLAYENVIFAAEAAHCVNC